MDEQEINEGIQNALDTVDISEGVWKGFAPTGLEVGAQYAVWSPLDSEKETDAAGEVWQLDIELNVWGGPADEEDLKMYSNEMVQALKDDLETELDGATVIFVRTDPASIVTVENEFGQANRDIRLKIEV